MAYLQFRCHKHILPIAGMEISILTLCYPDLPFSALQVFFQAETDVNKYIPGMRVLSRSVADYSPSTATATIFHKLELSLLLTRPEPASNNSQVVEIKRLSVKRVL